MSEALTRALGPALLESTAALVAVVDASHRIVLSNPSFDRAFGARQGEPCYRVYRGRDDVCDACPLDQVFVERTACEHEHQGIDRNGNALVLSMRLVPLPGGSGRVAHVLQVSLDITRLRELEQGLDQAERLANVGLTTAGLAHTIKNILAGLEGGIYVVNSGLDKNDMDRLKGGWGMVQRYIEQVTALVKNLLRYARAQEPVREAVEPGDLVRRVVELYETKAALADIELEGSVADELPTVSVDPEGMHACLTNLVANAVDACTWDPDTDKAHRITLRASRGKAGGVVFEVQDNGMGIAAEDQPKILNLHFTTKGIRGTGLGLLLTKKAVQEHGGAVSFSSVPGQGTTFRIELPAS